MKAKEMREERMVEVDYEWSGRYLSYEAEKICDSLIGEVAPISKAEEAIERVWDKVEKLKDVEGISHKEEIFENVTFYVKDAKTGETIDPAEYMDV